MKMERMTERELLNQRVITLRELRSGMMTIAAGTKATITRKFKGLTLESDKCRHCGVGVHITRVPYDAVRLLIKVELPKEGR